MTLFIGTALEAGLRRALGATGTAPGAPRSLRRPKLVGTGRIGDVVDVDPGDWIDAATLSFAWLRNGAPVPGAIAASYAPLASDDRSLLACRVTASNETGRTEVQTPAITIRFPPAPLAGAFLYIRYMQLTGPHIVIESPFFPEGSLSFRITGDGVSVDSATGLVTIPAASLLSGVSVLMTAPNSGEKAVIDFSLRLNPAAPATLPALVAAPALSGTGLVGEALTLQPGVWDGEPAPDLAFQWLCDGAPIAGATGLAFTPGVAEDRSGLSCRVTASNAAGEAAAETQVVEIVRTAPLAIGVLDDVVLAQGGAAQALQAAVLFVGDALRFSVAGAGAMIDPDTGDLTLATDALRVTEIVTVTAENSGGDAVSAFAVTVQAAPRSVGAPAPVVLTQGTGAATIETAAYFAGSDLAFSLVDAPAGASIDAATGVATLATDAALTANLEVRATNAVGEASQVVPVTVQAAIFVVASKNTAGPSSSVSGLVPGDDVLVVVRRLDSMSAPLVPTGNPFGYTIVATATGATTVARMFHVKVKSSMLTGGVFATGNFTNVGTSKTFIVALRNVVSVTDAVATGGLRTTRAFSAVPGLSSSAAVVGFSFAGAGVPPVPAEAKILQDGNGRLWRAGPTAAWSPATAAAGSNVDWLEMAIGLNAAPLALGVPTPVLFAEGAPDATVAAAGFFAGSNLVYTLEAAPAGAVIDAASGVVTLSTAAPATVTMIVRATNAAGSAAQKFETRILAAPLVLGLAGSIVLVAGSGTRTVSTASFFAGEELTFALEASPAGATIDPVSGLATIPIATAAKTVLAVRATNLAGSVVRNFALTILAAPVVVGAPAAFAFEQGAGTATISSQAFFDGDGLVFSIDAAPEGVTINPSSGLVSIATDAAFEGAITVHATNAAGSATQKIALKIGAEGSVPEITPAAPLDGEWTLDQITVQK